MVFGIIWSYFLVRIFVTDIDYTLALEFTDIRRSTYIVGRFLLISTLIITYWISSGNKHFLKNVILLIAFPVFPIGFYVIKYIIWELPKYLLKKNSYYFLYTYIDAIITFIVKFKSKTIEIFVFINAVFLMKVLTGNYLYIVVCVFVIIMANHIYKRYKEAFSPIKVFQLQLINLKEKPSFSRSEFDADLKKAVKKSSEKTNKQIAQMEYFLMVGEFSRIFNQKISEILNSKSYFKSFLFKALYSFLLAMVLFGCINYCLFNINPTNFSYTGNPKYFEFFYYSFFTIFPDGSDIEPITRLSKLVRMIGVGVGVIINLLILVVLVTVKSERYKDNLQWLSKWSNSYSSEIAIYFEEKYGRKTADGLKFLLESGSEAAKYLDKFKKLLEGK